MAATLNAFIVDIWFSSVGGAHNATGAEIIFQKSQKQTNKSAANVIKMIDCLLFLSVTPHYSPLYLPE